MLIPHRAWNAEQDAPRPCYSASKLSSHTERLNFKDHRTLGEGDFDEIAVDAERPECITPPPKGLPSVTSNGLSN